MTRLNAEEDKEQREPSLPRGAQTDRRLWKGMYLYLAKLQAHISQLHRSTAGYALQRCSCIRVPKEHMKKQTIRETYLRQKHSSKQKSWKHNWRSWCLDGRMILQTENVVRRLIFLKPSGRLTHVCCLLSVRYTYFINIFASTQYFMELLLCIWLSCGKQMKGGSREGRFEKNKGSQATTHACLSSFW